VFFSVLAVLLTWLLGPFMFWLLSRRSSRKRWPVGVIDGWGDVVFLPLFNAAAVFFGVFAVFSSLLFGVSVLFGVVVAVAFMFWRRDIAAYDDWSRPKKGVFNAGGWYHSAYMLVQAGFVLYSFVALDWLWWLFLPFAGYVLMVGIRAITLFKNSL
jgi:hypothetical protein